MCLAHNNDYLTALGRFKTHTEPHYTASVDVDNVWLKRLFKHLNTNAHIIFTMHIYGG